MMLQVGWWETTKVVRVEKTYLQLIFAIKFPLLAPVLFSTGS